MGGKIAVKVINHYGDEVLRAYDVRCLMKGLLRGWTSCRRAESGLDNEAKLRYAE